MKQFSYVKVKAPKKSVFDLSHEKKLTCEMGELIPVYLQEVIPSDKFTLRMDALVKFQALLSPLMHRINLYGHFFFVPYRLIWDDWEDFITGGRNGDLEPNFPKFQGYHSVWNQYVNLGSLSDYFGIPVTEFSDTSDAVPGISQLPYRAYQLIYNEYYRDNNLEDEVLVHKDSLDRTINTTESRNVMQLRKRAWEKDYFTSALPFAQRGADVHLPLSGSAPVSGEMAIRYLDDDTVASFAQGQIIGEGGRIKEYTGTTNRTLKLSSPSGTTEPLEADLSQATSATINELRTSFALQRWLERNARAGARYVEQILAHFGVKSSDARLQRPEFLGGGKIPVQIQEIVRTASEGTEGPVGEQLGKAMAAGNLLGFSKYFEEHGFIMGIMSILPRTAYYQGIPKILTKFDRFDYFFPDFANLGEQEIKSQELYLSEEIADNEETFGYQERYAEYRYAFDTVHGDFRDTLEFWHMARKFESKPILNKDFVISNPTERIYAIWDEQNPPDYKKVQVQLYFSVTAVRPIPKHGTPI